MLYMIAQETEELAVPFNCLGIPASNACPEPIIVWRAVPVDRDIFNFNQSAKQSIFSVVQRAMVREPRRSSS